MNKTSSFLVIILSLFVLLNCSVIAEQKGRPAGSDNGKAKPLAVDFDAIDLDGQAFHGKALKGKIVLLDFWAVWCGPCIAAFPTLQKLNHNLKKQNFEVVGIAAYSGTYKDVQPFVKKHGLEYKVVVGDEDLVERFGVIGYPTYFLIGADGKIRKEYVGEAKTLYSDVKREVSILNKRSK